jgi:DNA/RNA endonuclease G (NUC1)
MALAAMLLVIVSCDEEGTKPVEKTPELSVTPSAPDRVASTGGEITLKVWSNVDWTVTGVPEWMTVKPASGNGSNYDQPVSVTVEKNDGGAREAVLTFSNKGVVKDVKIQQNHSFGNDAPEGVLFFEAFTNGIGNFIIKDITVPDALSFVWEYSSQYKCMKATAYENATTNNYASESWLISPDITIPADTKSYLTFEHAGGYFGTASKEATVWVSKDGGEWEQLVIDSKDYPTSWTFVSAGNWDMSKYAGGTIKIAFKYTSTATKAGTWEVRNVSIMLGEHQEVVVPNVDPKTTQWMELPAMDNKAYGYYSHSFSMNNEIYRNYSFAWSQKDLVSVWVAYPLSKVYTDGYVGRTEKWAHDPVLGKDKSSNPGTGYAGDYDRGHQLPSADRQSSRTANEQTFYGTNIAPQLNAHNTTIWKDLEDKVRTVASTSDTVYVVTGCVVDGATEFSTDTDGKAITIPVAFFKALLRVSFFKVNLRKKHG